MNKSYGDFQFLIDREGNVTKSKFYEAAMLSHARLTYTKVWKAVGENDAEAIGEPGAAPQEDEPRHEADPAQNRHDTIETARRQRARRFEYGSTALLEHIRRPSPGEVPPIAWALAAKRVPAHVFLYSNRRQSGLTL